MRIEDVWRTRAASELFNGITRMHLVDRDGEKVLFSRRKKLTELIIGLMLEAGFTPKDMSPWFWAEVEDEFG